MTRPLLTVNDVAACYPGRPQAVSQVSFSVEAGEAVAVIGPSGAGKTTLFRTLARLQAPSCGSVTLDGRDLYGPHARRELRGAIGLVHQQHALPKAISVAMAVLAGRMHSWPSWKVLSSAVTGPSAKELDEVRQVLEHVGLAGSEHRRVGELSVGQRQRVAVARTLLQQPKLVIADEPVASLDCDNAETILRLLVERATPESAVLCAVHDVARARAHFDRIVGLREGRLIFDVSTERFNDGLLASLNSAEAA